jgi:hypothetical protein
MGGGHGGDAESNGGGRGSRSDAEDAGVYARWGRERKANAGFGRQIHGEPEKKYDFCLHFILFSSRDSFRSRDKIYLLYIL